MKRIGEWSYPNGITVGTMEKKLTEIGVHKLCVSIINYKMAALHKENSVLCEVQRCYSGVVQIVYVNVGIIYTVATV